MENIMRLVCFGDSICYGYGARPGEGWVSKLAWKLAALSSPISVINAGINGDTTDDGLARMRRDVERHRPQWVYIQFGLNDCSSWGASSQISLQRYIANIREMLERSFRCGAHVVFLATNHPVAEAFPFGSDAYQKTVIAYNAALREQFWGMRGVVGVDIERHVLTDCPSPEKLVLSDGVHLSRAGNDFYCTTVAGYVMRYLKG